MGHCRNGKIVTSHTDLDGLTGVEEVFDAMVMLSILAIRSRRQDKNSLETLYLEAEVEKLGLALGVAEIWNAQMEAVGARTTVD